MSEKVIVSVSEGKIQGFKSTSPFSGAEFYSFLGVPYGESTAGFGRFKDPVPVKPWKTILNATTEKGGCLQFSLKKKLVDGSEDCLYNNIYTPKIPRKTDNDPLKAVVFFIHPGSCIHGSPDPGYFGSPDFVMHNDVVYVCASFRIHILGFLNLGMEECSGNQCYKDIILNLQWVQKNISNFGGDPNNVTLLGSSSGAQVINDLMISPRAKGLFHKGVIMGMYRYCPSIILREENSVVAYELAQRMGFKGPYDPKKLLLFYRRLDMNKFLFARSDRLTLHQEYAPFFPVSPFLPTYDYGENPVIPTWNKQMILKSMMRIPLMIGFTQNEAALGFLGPFRKYSMENYYKALRQNCWGWGYNLSDDQLQIIQKRVESHYLNGEPIENAPVIMQCDIQTDIALSDLYASLIDVVAADLPSSVYVYKFEFEGNVIKMKDLFTYSFDEPLPGTIHSDDFTYWSRFTLHHQKKDDPLKLLAPVDDKKDDPLKILTPETIEFINQFTKLISTFAKTGNPNYEGIKIEWKPTTVQNPCYMSLNTDLSMIDGRLTGKSMDFWDTIKEDFEKGHLTSD